MTEFRNLYAHGFARIAAASPRVYLADPIANARETIALMRRADADRAALLVCPELGLSGYTLDDLLNHPAAVMHEIDRALEREHGRHRLARWRTLVEQSLYADAGQVRVVNRWKRAMGVIEWAKTAP